MNAFEWLKDYLKLAGSEQKGNNWQCPAHEDSFPSLSMTCTNGGMVLLFCHAGCTYKQIMDALGLGAKLLFEHHTLTPERVYQQNLVKPKFKSLKHNSRVRKNKSHKRYSIIYHPYTDVVRLERIKYVNGDKMCRWQILENERWVYSNGNSLNLNLLPLYNEIEVIRGGYVGEVIVLCESESSVDALLKLGIYGTTWAGGANSVKIERLIQVLKNQKVLWIPDNDEAGLKCSAKITKKLKPHTYKWQTLIGAPKEDARDLISTGKLNPDLVKRLFQ
jgi:5S rRNA maturation endonuclease (ribonuclease M5)